jgi:Ca-activated chloride channel family protein
MLAQRGRLGRTGTLCLLGCACCLIVALAQPRWGRLAAPALAPGHDVVLLIDVSRSMGAEDAVPSRLAVALESAESLVHALGHDEANRAAVVAFAGRGVLRCPLTENLGAVLAALHRLRPGGVQPGGTDLGAGLDAALDAVGTEEHAHGRAAVIFSDGEDHANRWDARLERLHANDLVVHTVAIGDADAGHVIPGEKPNQPLLFQGEPVLSRRSDAALEAIAQQTGGTFVRFGLASTDLGTLYRTKIEPAARTRHESGHRLGGADQFSLFLLAALGLLLAGCRPVVRGWNWPRAGGWRLGLMSRGVCLALIAVAGLTIGAGKSPSNPGAESAAEANLRGRAAYDASRLDEALGAFELAIARVPGSPIPRYNAAATAFQLGRYAEARQLYFEARSRAGGSLRTKIDYALGNTALALGDIPGAISSYDACLASTEGGAALDAVRRDAAINRRFALEQARSLAISHDENPDNLPKSDRPNHQRNSNRDNGAGEAPDGNTENDATSAGTSPPADGEGNRPPASRRRMGGGAGGGGSTPSRARGDSPEDRLDAALEQIRAALDRRLPEEMPPVSGTNERKDW